jgi:protein ImuA
MDMSPLPSIGLPPVARLPGDGPDDRSDDRQVPRWRPGLALPLHGEIMAEGCDAAGAGLALALLLDGLAADGRAAQAGDGREEKALLWVQDATCARLTGRPYRPGLPPPLRHRLIHVLAKKPEDALFALEEGVRCRDLACVIGEIAGNPKALDFTASRRLSLAAQRHAVPLLLVRIDAQRDLSSARMRWQVRPAPSTAPRWNAAAPGAPAWQAELFRSRSHAPGQWLLRAAEMGLAVDDQADDLAPASRSQR